MSDIWERMVGFHVGDDGTQYPEEAPGADPDLDGPLGNPYTNLREAFMGTDPNSFASRLTISILPGAPEGFVDLRFPTISKKLYQIEYSWELGEWLPLGSELEGDGAEATVREQISLQAGIPVFFRLVGHGDYDADADGLTAWEEEQIATSDSEPDSDGDRVSDRDEYMADLDPLDASSVDGDAIPDDWERFFLGGIAGDGTGNADGDAFNDLDEFRFGLDPNADDSQIRAQTFLYNQAGRLQTAGPMEYGIDAEGNVESATSR